MNYIINTLGIFILFSINGCELLKDEDQRISEALIGKVTLEDRVTNQGTKLKNVKGEFYKDGKFVQDVTVELIYDELYEVEPTDVFCQIIGNWEVRDKLLYLTYDYNSIKIIPKHYDFWKEKMISDLKNRNFPDKIIDYDATKIIFEKPDGERRTMKKIS